MNGSGIGIERSKKDEIGTEDTHNPETVDRQKSILEKVL